MSINNLRSHVGKWRVTQEMRIVGRCQVGYGVNDFLSLCSEFNLNGLPFIAILLSVIQVPENGFFFAGG